MPRVLHRVEVIEIAEEFVEPVDGGQELVPVSQVVLPELSGGVAQLFQSGGDGRCLGRDADGTPAWPTVVSPVRIGNSPVMKLARPAVQLASA